MAILSVMAFHLKPYRVPGGFAGVDIFFVISGFVVTASMAHLRFDRLRDLLGYFYRRRAVRILPALLVLLTATTLASVLFIPFASYLSRTAGLSAYFGVSNMEFAMMGRGYFAPGADLNPFLHTWTLGVEEQFYLIFPLFFFFWQRAPEGSPAKRRAVAAVAIATLLSLAACYWLELREQRLAFYLMPARFWELGVGMLLGLTFARWRDALQRWPAHAVALAYVLGLAAIGASCLWLEVEGFPFPAALLPVAGAAMLIALVCSHPDALPARLLGSAPAVFVGRLSYSLYLWHWPVFALFRWTVGMDERADWLSATALSFALAMLSYYLIEQPTRRSALFKRGRPWRVVGGGALATAACAGAAFFLMRAEYQLSLNRLVRLHDPALFDPGSGCALDESSRRLASGRVVLYQPLCRRAAGGMRLVVAGDSHAERYEPLFRRYASDTGVPVIAYLRPGCDFPTLSVPLAHRPECRTFHDRATAELARDLRRGDVLFLSSLRVPMFFGSPEPELSDRDRRRAYLEARSLLARLAASGARIVIEAPKPVYRSAPIECSEWYSRGNPRCIPGFSIPRGEQLAFRAGAMTILARLHAEVPNLSIWDPFPILCPDEPCNAYEGDRPLFLDYNHLSRFGAERVYPSFRRTIGAPAAAPSEQAAGP